MDLFFFIIFYFSPCTRDILCLQISVNTESLEDYQTLWMEKTKCLFSFRVAWKLFLPIGESSLTQVKLLSSFSLFPIYFISELAQVERQLLL